MRVGRENQSFAFTLVEVVVVIMILGILAAIAMPRVLTAADVAADNSAKHTLSVIREAIDSFTAHHPDQLPGADGNESTFTQDLKTYLRGAEFPKCPVGPAKNNRVRMLAGATPIATGIGGTESTYSWVYKVQTGDFHINCNDTAVCGSTYDRF
jgi:prepilin-type N-terminal cleavage/methylation domain-containing protein